MYFLNAVLVFAFFCISSAPNNVLALNSFHFFAPTTTITYNVISTLRNNHAMGVIVDGVTYPLEPSKEIPILHSGRAPAGDYSYAQLDLAQGVVEKEAFRRQLDQSLEATPNEFYNRTWNTFNVTQLPTLLDTLPSVNRLDSPLHPKDQIPTIYLSGDQNQIDLMHSNTSLDTKVTVDMHLIETDKITTVKGVVIGLAGRSSRWMDKLSYGLKTPKDLFGYRKLKLRALRSDPSYIREILCYDLMKSMGLPVSGASYARVIMNDQPVGLFLMIEGYKNNWYKNEFNGGKKLKNGRGVTYLGAGVHSDLSYLGDNATVYGTTYKIAQDPDKNHGAASFVKLKEFTKFLSQAPTTTKDATDTWDKHIDMESVIRSLVVEIIGGFSDGYIANANNYFLYDNLAETRFTYLAADFDTTLGNTVVKLSNMWSGNYSQFPGFSLRPLLKLVQVPALKSRFEQLLYKTSCQLINPASINPRIDSLVQMLRQDVEWDTRLPKMNKDTTNTFTRRLEYLLNHPEHLPPTMDWDTLNDTAHLKPLSWNTAVNGPTHHISLSGVKEWFEHQSMAIQDYFVHHPPYTIV